jgi:3'-phosphoadenosine 5'-phosphosulfate sulfotransferase (PAPS reductase)/FAD synthetase
MEHFLASAENLLRLVRRETDAIGVAVSFGKDSLATLDLCCRIFPRVEGYYLFRVRGLSIVDEWAEVVRVRHGVNVRMYPHFDLSRCYRNAVLQPHWKGLQKAPAIKMADVEAKFRSDVNVSWIAYGWRRNDSFSRALIMKKCGGYDPAARRVFPLRSWRRADVLAYLESKGIPLPPSLGRKEQGGLDFHPDALETLRTERPQDYDRWLRDFPFSGMQLASRHRTDPGSPGSKLDRSAEGSP